MNLAQSYISDSETTSSTLEQRPEYLRLVSSETMPDLSFVEFTQQIQDAEPHASVTSRPVLTFTEALQALFKDENFRNNCLQLIEGLAKLAASFQAQVVFESLERHQNKLANNLSPEIKLLAKELGIYNSLQKTLLIAGDVFTGMRNLQVTTEVDPDDGKERLMLEVSVEGTAADVYAQYKNFIQRFSREIPAMDGAKMRLFTSVV